MAGFHFVFGEETFLVEQTVQQRLADMPSVSVKTFPSDVAISTLLEALDAQLLFEPSLCILVKNPWFLQKAVPDAQLRLLTQFCEAVKGASHEVIFMQMGGVDQRKKASKLLKKHAQCQGFEPYKDWEQDKVYAWLRQYVSDQSASIEMPAVMALEQIGGVNLRALAAEVDKVLVYIAPRTDIQEADIYAVCSAASASLFRFQEALKTRQVPMIFSSLTQLLAHSEDAIRLMALVAASFRLYFQVLVLDRDRVPVQKMGPQLGKNPYYLKRILADVKRAYSVEELRACFGILSTYDIKIKTGQMKPDQALTVALTRCVA